MLIFAITCRKLADTDEAYWKQLGRIAASGVDFIILREPWLDEKGYASWAARFVNLCEEGDAAPILHRHPKLCRELGVESVHMPLPLLMGIGESAGLSLGTSVHSAAETRQALEYAPRYMLASNVYETGCKPKARAKGLGLIEDVRLEIDKSRTQDTALIALGGIGLENAKDTLGHGADGVALMSGFMKAEDPKRLINDLRTL